MENMWAGQISDFLWLFKVSESFHVFVLEMELKFDSELIQLEHRKAQSQFFKQLKHKKAQKSVSQVQVKSMKIPPFVKPQLAHS